MTQNATSAITPALDTAVQSLRHAHEAIADQPLSADAAHAAVAELHQLTSTLADLVNLLQEQLPAAVAGTQAQSETAASELRADLRSLHGCITTGMRLLEPALEDIRGLASPVRTDSIDAAPRHRGELATLTNDAEAPEDKHE